MLLVAAASSSGTSCATDVSQSSVVELSEECDERESCESLCSTPFSEDMTVVIVMEMGEGLLLSYTDDGKQGVESGKFKRKWTLFNAGAQPGKLMPWKDE